MSTSAMFWSRPFAGSDGAIRPNTSCVAYDSTSMTRGLSPADSAMATRSSTFSLREAAIRTSTSSGLFGRRAEDLEVEVDLVERERDVLVGLGLDGELELLFLLAGGHDDFLRDDHGRGQRHGNIAVAAAEALPAALERVADLVEVGDVAVGHRVLGQGLDGVPLEPERALSGLRQLDQLDRGRSDIDPDQRRGLRFEEVERSTELFGKHGSTRAKC